MRLALPGLFVAVAAALLAAGGCAGGTSTIRASSDVERFVALASSGVNIDYTPLSSPRDAIEKSDLVVEGTVSGVIDGARLQYPDPLYTQRKAGSYATLVISVDRVLSGDASKVVGGRVYVEVHKSHTSSIGDLSAANPRPRTVAVLDDITTWKPPRGHRDPARRRARHGAAVRGLLRWSLAPRRRERPHSRPVRQPRRADAGLGGAEDAERSLGGDPVRRALTDRSCQGGLGQAAPRATVGSSL